MVNSPGLLDRERIVAGPGFNRWLVPPAALCIHLCIGMAYGFSVFWKPLQGALVGADGKPLPECSAGAATFGEKAAGTLRALTATDCNWSQFDLGWMYTFFFVLLGVSAAIWGYWLERAGPRKAGLVSTACWCGGLLIAALGVYFHQLWMLWLGSGIIGGIGLGLGYISPVSTLIKWFPDRRGMATGMAIMGFGGGAMIGSPLATVLMSQFKTDTSPGVWETFVALAAIYFVFMFIGSFGYRLPPGGWKPEGWTPPANGNAMISSKHVHLKDAHKTPQFWLLWLVLCMNVSAGIGIIGAASPMLQETFGGALAGAMGVGYLDMKKDAVLAAAAAAVGAGFVGLISLFNIFGRIAWASSSDKLGRKVTYFIFFVLGAALYILAAFSADWQDPGAIRHLLLRHRIDVRGRLRDHTRLSRRHVRNAVRRSDPWPPADGVVDGRHSRPRGRQLSTRYATGLRRAARSGLRADLLYPRRHAGGRLHRQSSRQAGQSEVAHERCGCRRRADEAQVCECHRG